MGWFDLIQVTTCTGLTVFPLRCYGLLMVQFAILIVKFYSAPSDLYFTFDLLNCMF